MCQILFTSFTKEKYLDKYLKKYFAKLCQPHYWCSICLAPPPSLCVGKPTWHCKYQQFIIVHHWILVHKYQYLRERTEHQRTWTTNTGLQCCCRGSPRSQEAAPCSTKLGCGECPSRPRQRGVVVARRAAVGTPWEQSRRGARPGNLSHPTHQTRTCEELLLPPPARAHHPPARWQ